MDALLAIYFSEQISDVFTLLPEATQCMALGATLPPRVLALLLKTYMHDPVRIEVKGSEPTLEGIKQFFIPLDNKEAKLDTLCDLFSTLTFTQAIIYCKTRKSVVWLTEQMTSRDIFVSSMHGATVQKERDIIMREFRSGALRVLITMDKFARNIDLQKVPLVINYDLPTAKEMYTHRVRRSGGFGYKTVISLIAPADVECMRDIEKYYSTPMQAMPADITDLMAC